MQLNVWHIDEQRHTLGWDKMGQVHMHTHTHTHTYIHKYIHTYIHTYIHHCDTWQLRLFTGNQISRFAQAWAHRVVGCVRHLANKQKMITFCSCFFFFAKTDFVKIFAMICNDLICKIINLRHVPKTVLHYPVLGSEIGRVEWMIHVCSCATMQLKVYL